jgi:tetratricopeptide (TPR) repeat protein
MRFFRVLTLGVTMLSFVCGNLSHAAATPTERTQARDVFRRAQQHYKLAEYVEALDAFKEAYRLIEDPSLLFNIAQCYRQLNKKEEALRFYRTYLHDAGKAGIDHGTEQIVASLEQAIKEEQAARNAQPQATLEQPPPPVLTPAPNEAPATAVLVTPAVRTADKPPVYRRWWLWTTVAAVVVVGVGVGLGVGLTRTPAAPSVSTSDGTFHPF